MADTNEAQLLSDLLRDVAREDARLDAAHLEARVMAAVEAAATVRLKPDTTYSARKVVGSCGGCCGRRARAGNVLAEDTGPCREGPSEGGRH